VWKSCGSSFRDESESLLRGGGEPVLQYPVQLLAESVDLGESRVDVRVMRMPSNSSCLIGVTRMRRFRPEVIGQLSDVDAVEREGAKSAGQGWVEAGEEARAFSALEPPHPAVAEVAQARGLALHPNAFAEGEGFAIALWLAAGWVPISSNLRMSVSSFSSAAMSGQRDLIFERLTYRRPVPCGAPSHL